MSINKGVPAQPEDENNNDEHAGNWADVADVGAQGMSAALGAPRTSGVPSVSAPSPASEAAAAASAATEPATTAGTQAADSGLSVAGDLVEGVLDVITGILDAD
jgi:hypothetical protein